MKSHSAEELFGAGAESMCTLWLNAAGLYVLAYGVLAAMNEDRHLCDKLLFLFLFYVVVSLDFSRKQFRHQRSTSYHGGSSTGRGIFPLGQQIKQLQKACSQKRKMHAGRDGKEGAGEWRAKPLSDTRLQQHGGTLDRSFSTGWCRATTVFHCAEQSALAARLLYVL